MSASAQEQLVQSLGYEPDRPLLRVCTEPKIPGRYWSFERAPTIEVHDLLSTPRRHRRVAAVTALLRILNASRPDAILFFDSSEGWLSSTLARLLKSCRPDLRLVGLQHGAMPIPSGLGQQLLMSARKRLTDLQISRLGFAVAGAGFGNTVFDGYCVYGPVYRELIMRSNQTSKVVACFPMLSGVGEVYPYAGTFRGTPSSILFMDQPGVGTAKERSRVHAALSRLAAQHDLPLQVRRHPRQIGHQASSRLTDPRIPVARALAECDESVLVASYFSTGLLEADWIGHPTMSISTPTALLRHRAIYRAMGEHFAPHALDRLDLDHCTLPRLRSGLTSGLLDATK